MKEALLLPALALIMANPLDLALVLIILYQAWRIKVLKGSTEAWYALWQEKAVQLKRARARKRKVAR